jgi:hypothetical protein
VILVTASDDVLTVYRGRHHGMALFNGAIQGRIA